MHRPQIAQELFDLEEKFKKLKLDNDGRVKMVEKSDAKFLSELIDAKTIVNDNGILKAKTLDGLEVTVQDLNLLKGAKENIQSQIDTLSKAIVLLGEVPNFSTLKNSKDNSNGDAYIVQSDETHNGDRTWYVYSGNGWVCLGTLTVKIRDFVKNPLDLTKEVKGKLSENNMDLDRINKEIEDLKKQLKDGKDVDLTPINQEILRIEKSMNDMKKDIEDLKNNAPKVDLSQYQTKADAENEFASKEDLKKLAESLKNISKAITLIGELATCSSLPSKDNTSGDAYIIQKDEKHNNAKTWYVWDGNQWIFLGTMSVESRDFIKNPLDLETEIKGELALEHIDLSNLNAKDVKVDCSQFNKNLKDKQIKSVQDLADSIDKIEIELSDKKAEDIDLKDYYKKEEIDKIIGKYDKDNDGVIDVAKVSESIKDSEKASPLTFYGKNNKGEIGFHYLPLDNFKESSSCKVEQRVKLNAKANTSFVLAFAKDKPNNDLFIQPYRYEKGSENIVQVLKDFDNTDELNFFYDKDNVEFDGVMKSKKKFEIKLNKDNTLSKNELIISESEVIKLSDYVDINNIELEVI